MFIKRYLCRQIDGLSRGNDFNEEKKNLVGIHDCLRVFFILYAIIISSFGSYFGYFTSTNYVIRPCNANGAQWRRKKTHTINMKYAFSKKKISYYSTRSFSNSIKLYSKRTKIGSTRKRNFCRISFMSYYSLAIFFLCVHQLLRSNNSVAVFFFKFIFVCFELWSSSS